MDAGALLAGLTNAQQEAVTSTAAPLCVVAGAGSGKTSVLTRRMAWRCARGTAEADHILALTFTRKAAAELRRRLGQLGVSGPVAAGTFHGVALAQLRQWSADRRRPAPVVLADPARLVGRVLVAAGASADPRTVARATAEIARAKARGVGAGEAVGASWAAGMASSDLAAISAAYEREKRRRGVVDLDDLIEQCARAVLTDEDFAERQRWRFRHLFVDEYQDVNPSHARLLSAWLGDRLDLCVVGDPRQSVYGWNGADPSLLDRFTEHFPTAVVVHLDHNFRCSPEIASVASAVLSSAVRTVPAGLGGSPIPTVTGYADDVEEATAVARSVRDAHSPGSAWSEIAVLSRTNGPLRLLAEALSSAGIPAHISGRRPLSDLAAVQSVIGGRDPCTPARSVLADTRLALADTRGATVGGAGGGGAGGGGAGGGAAELRALLDVSLAYLDLDPAGDLGGLLQWIEVCGRTLDAPGGDAVVLSTFHRAKGLEWSTVYLTGLEDGFVPMAGATGSALEEERRLLYVAATRAATHLRCSWAARRTIGGVAVTRRPSPLLAGLQEAAALIERAHAPVDGRAALAGIRRQLAEAGVRSAG